MPKVLLKFQNIIFRLMPEKSFAVMGVQKKNFIKLTDSMLNLDFSNRLKELSCTTLIICVEKDTANKKPAKDLAENIPNAEFSLIKNTGHEVNV